LIHFSWRLKTCCALIGLLDVGNPQLKTLPLSGLAHTDYALLAIRSNQSLDVLVMVRIILPWYRPNSLFVSSSRSLKANSFIIRNVYGCGRKISACQGSPELSFPSSVKGSRPSSQVGVSSMGVGVNPDGRVGLSTAAVGLNPGAVKMTLWTGQEVQFYSTFVTSSRPWFLELIILGAGDGCVSQP